MDMYLFTYLRLRYKFINLLVDVEGCIFDLFLTIFDTCSCLENL